MMDEPLSNVNAQLRVQMRAEITELQSALGITTIYVTHDQVEAMTMAIGLPGCVRGSAAGGAAGGAVSAAAERIREGGSSAAW